MKLLPLTAKGNWVVLVLVLVLSVICILTVLSWGPKQPTLKTRNEIVNYDPSIFQSQETVVAPGNANLIPGIVVHGAMIMTGHHLPPKTLSEYEFVNARIEHSRAFTKQLPFPVTEWFGVYSKPCPHWPKALIPSEHAVAFAHFRIFHDFAYFDPFLLHEYKLNKSTYTTSTLSYNGKSIKSSDGLYEIFQDGTMFKNGQRYSDNDIIIIFEDDAEIMIKDFNATLLHELMNMKEDMVLLGFTPCRYLKVPIPLGAHAYAVRRAGAKKYIKYFEPCGPPVDLQYLIMDHQKQLTVRKAFDSSYMHSYLSGEPNVKGKCGDTLGIFIQNKATMGSLNGHIVSGPNG